MNINNMSMLEAALAYAAMGFKVFPVHGIINGKCTCGYPGCKAPNSGKHPATQNGLKAATDNSDTIRSWFEKTNWNVAIATGAGSKIWVLDIDGAQGEESLNNLEKINGKLPLTMESTTGRGRHLIFKHTGEEIRNSASKIGLKIDARGDGGYIVAPPSRHYSGAVYTMGGGALEYAPDWLFDLAHRDKAKAEIAALPADLGDSRADVEWDVADVRNMLAALDPDMGYEEWLHIGMALHEGGYSVTIWDEWSRRGKKYQAGDCVKRWKGFNGSGRTMGTLVAMAQEHGWEPRKSEGDPIGAEIAARIHAAFMAKKSTNVVEIAKKRPETIIPPLKTKISFPVPTEVGGIIGETVKWIVDTAIKPQPELALLNVIAALGAVFGRRYKGQGRLDTRTNLYVIGVAGTGSGKDHSRKQMNFLMNSAGLASYVGTSRFVSDSGLITSLQKQPSQIMAIDEIGLILQAMSDKKAAGHIKNISTHLLTLYSSSGSFFNGGQYADKEKEAVIIPAPNLCIYGTTTADSYIKSLTTDSVKSGEMNRFIVIPVKEEIPDRKEDDECETTPAQALMNAWESLKPSGDLNALNISTVTPTPTVVVWNKEIGLRLKNMGDIEDEKMRENSHGVGALWNRYRENVLKVAMIFAIARNQHRPEIVSSDMDVAEGIVLTSIDYMTKLCIENISDSEHQKNCQRVLAVVKREKEITQSGLWNFIRYLNPKELKEVLESLEGQGIIEVAYETDTTKKKRAKIIRLAR